MLIVEKQEYLEYEHQDPLTIIIERSYMGILRETDSMPISGELFKAVSKNIIADIDRDIQCLSDTEMEDAISCYLRYCYERDEKINSVMTVGIAQMFYQTEFLERVDFYGGILETCYKDLKLSVAITEDDLLLVPDFDIAVFNGQFYTVLAQTALYQRKFNGEAIARSVEHGSVLK